MIALIQRVKSAHVEVAGSTVGEIQQGLLVLLGVEQQDTEARAKRLCERVLNYRVFSDENGKMNLNVRQVGGGVLVVSQFTLVADTSRGNRPGFSRGASPGLGRQMYEYFVQQVAEQNVSVATGEFGADMQVHLVNDGPVTFSLSI